MGTSHDVVHSRMLNGNACNRNFRIDKPETKAALVKIRGRFEAECVDRAQRAAR